MSNKLFISLLVAAAIVAGSAAAPAPAAPAAETAGDVPAPAGTPAVPKLPAAAGSAPAAEEPAGGTPVPKLGAAATAKSAAPPPDAEAAAAEAEIDLTSIPKLDASEAVVTAGGSTAVSQNNTKGAKQAAGQEFPLDGFEPVYPAGKEANENQILIDVVTDSPIETIKTNQVPFIQSLADALGVSTNQIYWYKLIKSDLNIAKFLVDTDSKDSKAKVLANLANPDNTGRFYANAAAYTLNILNGPEVAPDQLQLSAEVISTPDNYTAYNGDTGLISNNATAGAAASAAQAVHFTGAMALMFTVIALIVSVFSMV